MGHPVLPQKAVADIVSVQSLIRDMRETLADSGGIGLAAPQVHESTRVILASVPDHRRADQPRIGAGLSGTGQWLGRLPLHSRPARAGAAPFGRALQGTVGRGRAAGRRGAGHDGAGLAHEADHLGGVLYPMRMKDHTRFGFDEEIA